ncbi:MAG: type II toxin-antitoxin system VapC family toxin [Gammaproteobacteria bacterium]
MILLDTCAILWLASAQENLSEQAKQVIHNNANALFVSAISAFEIGAKVNRGLIKLPLKIHDWFNQALLLHGLVEIPVDSTIAIQSTQLPLIHKDPADRLIIATALLNHFTILTPDQHIKNYPQIKTLW